MQVHFRAQTTIQAKIANLKEIHRTRHSQEGRVQNLMYVTGEQLDILSALETRLTRLERQA